MKYFVYLKQNGVDKKFHLFDLSKGEIVNNVLYAPIYSEEDLPKIKTFMLRVAAMQLDVVFQLRPTENRNRVVWTTCRSA